MSKKILSVLLAVVMIITASFGGMTVSAEGLTNYVGDGGFENADFSGTIPNYGAGSSPDMATWGRFSSGVTRMELVTSDNYSGDDSVALNGNKYMKSGVTTDGAYIRGFGQRLELTAGDYLLTFIAKSDADGLFSAGVYPTTEASIDVNKAIAYTYLDATNYWKEYTVDFSVPSDGMYYLMMGGNTGGDNNIRLFYMDNVAVYAKSDNVTVNAVATAGGTVTGGGVAAKGDAITLTATAKSGYEFTGWSDGEASATRTLTATADVSYTANFKKLSADYVPNGDFEADDWALSDYWTTLSGNSAFLEIADPENANNTVAYAKGATAAISMVSKNTITLKQGHTYILKFDSYMSNTVAGNGTNFYRVGFVKPGSANLGGASFVSSAFYSVYSNTTPSELSIWKKFTYCYTHNAADTEANIVLGLYNQECTSDWYVDNIVAYDEADLCEMTVTADKGGKIEGAKSTYFAGDVLTLTAIAKSGFEFAGWSDGVTDATRNVTATNGATYHANFTRKATANIVIDGDFEADEWAVAETWGVVNAAQNDKTFTKATESGNTYAVTTPETKQSLASDIITVKPGETYTLTFDSMFIDSGKTLTGDMNGFYRYGFIEATQTALGGGAFTALAGNNYASFSPGAMSDARFGVWETVTKEYTNNTDADVSVKAVIGYYNDECGYEWRVDNVVLSKASDYGVGKTVVGGFENGTDGWTASEGATITTANTADTALGSFKKYLGNNIGVLNPAAEGDTFTSPAFATESGKTYDVVIYTRHNSADDARGAFSFTAGGAGEVMKQANYGKPENDSEIGKYENNDGFMVVPDNANKDNFVSSTFVKLIFTFTATANSHNITITTLTPVSAFIDGFEVYCHDDFVKLAKDSLGFKGTAIRITGVQGLRFKNTINVEALKNFGNYAKVVEYGTLAIKEEYKKGAITFENLTDGTYEYTKSGGTVGSHLKCGVAYNVETNTDTVFASNLYAKDFTGVLIGITEENYSANYVTRAYAKVQFADGSYTYVYGDEQVASITAVAQHIVNNNLESEAVREYLTTNILG